MTEPLTSKIRGKAKKLYSKSNHIQTSRKTGEKKTSINGEELQTLTRLGLTIVQSKVYLALITSGYGTIKTIAKTAQIDRSEAYRGIAELQKIGLVEKELTRPTVFKCVAMNDGLTMLLERKNKEFHDIKTQTTRLIRKFKEHKRNQTLEVEGCQFVIVPEREVSLRRWMNATECAQESLDFIIRWKGLVDGLVERTEHYKRMMSRGVKVRGIVSEPENLQAISGIVKELKKRGSYDLKYMLTPPEAVFSIIDKKEVLFNITLTSLPMQTPSLWSNNPSLAAVIQDYFELKWQLLKANNRQNRTPNHEQELISH